MLQDVSSLPFNNSEAAVECGGGAVSRAIIAGIWVAFLQECQQSSCEQGAFDLQSAYSPTLAELPSLQAGWQSQDPYVATVVVSRNASGRFP